mmetsp:Transcript_39156/g.81282  ORF Transcript_39156/g.81282 Transcript_39156/m.81282 type:complete len:227 (-) Transcript_39156:104-784(-)
MGKFIEQFHLFHQISRHTTDQFIQIIDMKLIIVIVVLGGRQPKTNIFVTGWIFGIGLKGNNLTRRKLGRKAFILRPKQSNVGNVKQDHGPSFQSQSKSPSLVLVGIPTGIRHNFGMYHSTTQDFHPFILKLNFQFHGWFRKGKVFLHPAHFGGSKQVGRQSFQTTFQIVLNELEFTIGIALRRCQFGGSKEFDTLHLMKNGIMGTINFIPSIDITHHQETIQTRLQ